MRLLRRFSDDVREQLQRHIDGQRFSLAPDSNGPFAQRGKTFVMDERKKPIPFAHLDIAHPGVSIAYVYA